jgi:predicted short-subunit dehydrogenase-like oxidoreductase (DUF2520 family)
VDHAGTDARQATCDAELVFLTVPDDVIGEVCTDIVQRNGFAPGTAVYHCSGSQPSTILAAARDAGASVASLHPLQSFAGGRYPDNPFEGILISVEGDPEACQTGRRVVRDLGARCLDIETGGKVLYHASAVVASNYLVVLMDIALELMEGAGVPRERAFDILEPLVAGTLANIGRKATHEALTGPVARGDLATVAAHTNKIGSDAPRLLPLYKELGRHAVGLAEKTGTLPPEVVARLRALLKNE